MACRLCVMRRQSTTKLWARPAEKSSDFFPNMCKHMEQIDIAYHMAGHISKISTSSFLQQLHPEDTDQFKHQH
eukprot:11871788-Prorocentrum_lima.AAC.1